MDLSIIIVNFNVRHFLEQALISIQKATQSFQTEIFVVDNASQDGSVAMVQKKFPWVKLIINTKNRGFGAANNQALKQAAGRYIAMINPDTIIQEDTFFVLTKFFEEHPEAGMLGCKILNPDGTLQLACRRSFPSPWVAFSKISGLSHLFPGTKIFGRYNLTYLDPDESYEVEAISGSFMLARKTALDQVGHFDETWFMYGEDLDLCYRFREAGWKIFYVPATKIIHFKGESSKQSDFDTIRLFYQAMLVFVAKYHKSRILQFLLTPAIWLRAGIHFLKHFLEILFIPLIDLFFLNLSLILGLVVRFGNLQHIKSYIIVTIIYSTVWIGALFFSTSYTKHRFAASNAMLAVVSGLIINAFLTFFLNQFAYSRAVLLIAGLFNLLFLTGWRIATKLVTEKGNFRFHTTFGGTFWGRRTIIIGSGPAVEELIGKLRQQINGGYEIVGIVSFESADIGKQIKDIPILGTVENLDAIIRRQKVRDVLFATKQIAYEKIMEIMHQGRGLGVNYRLVPDNFEVIIGKSSIDYLGELPLIEMNHKIDRPVSIVLKRGLDIGVSLLVLFLGLPWFFYLRLIKRAPLRRFELKYQKNEKVTYWIFDTPRHRFAKLLPCFFSILLGEISLVGTVIVPQDGPHSTKNLTYTQKPGLAGLERIAKKSNMSEAEKQRYYLYYLKNYSLMLDIEILIKTIFK